MMKRLLPLLFLSAPVLAIPPTYVQSTWCHNGSGTSETCAFTTNVTAGSLIVVTCAGSRSGANLTVSDNASNSYTLINGTTTKTASGSSGVGGMWYAYNATGGATTVTCQDTRSNTTWLQMSIAEYTGERTITDPYDASSSSSPVPYVTTTLTAGPLNLVTYDSLIVEWCEFGTGAPTSQTGNLRLSNVDSGYDMFQDTTTLVPATNYQSTFTDPSGGPFFLCIQAEFGSPIPPPAAFKGHILIQ